MRCVLAQKRSSLRKLFYVEKHSSVVLAGHDAALVFRSVGPRVDGVKGRYSGSAIPRPQYLLNFGSRPGPATIGPCNITMDHDAIIFFMNDGLTRGPDQDVHVPSVGSQKYPSYNVDVIYL